MEEGADGVMERRANGGREKLSEKKERQTDREESEEGEWVNE